VQWGGYAEKARVRAAYLVRRPERLSARQAMAIGTAGFTAMLAVIALERHGLQPDAGDVLVTGAAGGLGSIAVALLSHLGYRVVASTGRADQRDYLTALGAADLVERASLGAKPSRPLDSERWAGAIDAVGGATDDPDPAPIRCERRRLRPRGRQRLACDGDPVPAARRQPARHRFSYVPA
jgi:acrylyl-CoA reductase (NADPH)